VKVLIACEESQEVCKAFRALGHEAYSCDIIDCSGNHPEWHIKKDVSFILNEGWDLMIAHPPCTRLCNSGVMWLHKRNLWNELVEACGLFRRLLKAPIKKICVENPIPHKYGLGKTYSQIVQPYMFGHMERKATCLWLKGLPKLKETNNVKEGMLKLPKAKQQRLHYLSPGPERAKLRSKTFKGVANAMADQWGKLKN